MLAGTRDSFGPLFGLPLHDDGTDADFVNDSDIQQKHGPQRPRAAADDHAGCACVTA